jgi:hypothetical protein
MWEKIHEPGPRNSLVESHRLKVPGGWVIRTIVTAHGTKNGVSVSQVFVPDISQAWTI